MSLTRCMKCDDIYDTDQFPEGYYDAEGNPRDGYLCDNCNEEEDDDSVF